MCVCVCKLFLIHIKFVKFYRHSSKAVTNKNIQELWHSQQNSNSRLANRSIEFQGEQEGLFPNKGKGLVASDLNFIRGGNCCSKIKREECQGSQLIPGKGHCNFSSCTEMQRCGTELDDTANVRGKGLIPRIAGCCY